MVGGGICGQPQLQKLLGPPAQGLLLWIPGAILLGRCVQFDLKFTQQYMCRPDVCMAEECSRASAVAS